MDGRPSVKLHYHQQHRRQSPHVDHPLHSPSKTRPRRYLPRMCLFLSSALSSSRLLLFLAVGVACVFLYSVLDIRLDGGATGNGEGGSGFGSAAGEFSIRFGSSRGSSGSGGGSAEESAGKAFWGDSSRAAAAIDDLLVAAMRKSRWRDLGESAQQLLWSSPDQGVRGSLIGGGKGGGGAGSAGSSSGGESLAERRRLMRLGYDGGEGVVAGEDGGKLDQSGAASARTLPASLIGSGNQGLQGNADVDRALNERLARDVTIVISAKHSFGTAAAQLDAILATTPPCPVIYMIPGAMDARTRAHVRRRQVEGARGMWGGWGGGGGGAGVGGTAGGGLGFADPELVWGDGGGGNRRRRKGRGKGRGKGEEVQGGRRILVKEMEDEYASGYLMRNASSELIRTKYALFVFSDVFPYRPNWLQHLFRFAEKHPEGVIFLPFIWEWGGGAGGGGAKLRAGGLSRGAGAEGGAGGRGRGVVTYGGATNLGGRLGAGAAAGAVTGAAAAGVAAGAAAIGGGGAGGSSMGSGSVAKQEGLKAHAAFASDMLFDDYSNDGKLYPQPIEDVHVAGTRDPSLLDPRESPVGVEDHCMLVRQSFLSEAVLFDPKVGFTRQDLDLALTTRYFNYKTYLVPQSIVVYHHPSSSVGARDLIYFARQSGADVCSANQVFLRHKWGIITGQQCRGFVDATLRGHVWTTEGQEGDGEGWEVNGEGASGIAAGGGGGEEGSEGKGGVEAGGKGASLYSSSSSSSSSGASPTARFLIPKSQSEQAQLVLAFFSLVGFNRFQMRNLPAWQPLPPAPPAVCHVRDRTLCQIPIPWMAVAARFIPFVDRLATLPDALAENAKTVASAAAAAATATGGAGGGGKGVVLSSSGNGSTGGAAEAEVRGEPELWFGRAEEYPSLRVNRVEDLWRAASLRDGQLFMIRHGVVKHGEKHPGRRAPELPFLMRLYHPFLLVELEMQVFSGAGGEGLGGGGGKGEEENGWWMEGSEGGVEEGTGLRGGRDRSKRTGGAGKTVLESSLFDGLSVVVEEKCFFPPLDSSSSASASASASNLSSSSNSSSSSLSSTAKKNSTSATQPKGTLLTPFTLSSSSSATETPPRPCVRSVRYFRAWMYVRHTDPDHTALHMFDRFRRSLRRSLPSSPSAWINTTRMHWLSPRLRNVVTRLRVVRCVPSISDGCEMGWRVGAVPDAWRLLLWAWRPQSVRTAQVLLMNADTPAVGE
ncbi:unnamed protein product [Closterium sp. NIES-53]